MASKKPTAAHDQSYVHRYIIHYPEHLPREDDPFYSDFHAFHKRTRPTARCYIGERIGFDACKDAQGKPCTIHNDGVMSGLELHHAHIEFALQNGVSLKALEKDYPGISEMGIGKWVESGQNFRWLCTYHHRGDAGAHNLSHSDFEASQYIINLVESEPPNAM